MKSNTFIKISSIICLLVFIAPILIYISFFVKQKIAQFQMEEKLETTLLQTIALPKAKVIWIKNGKEILVNGNLFDVKSIKEINNEITFTGLFDKDETKLVNHISKVMKHQKDQNKQQENSFYKLIMFVGIIPTHQVNVSFSSIIKAKEIYYKDNLLSISLPINLPPPNVV